MQRTRLDSIILRSLLIGLGWLCLLIGLFSAQVQAAQTDLVQEPSAGVVSSFWFMNDSELLLENASGYALFSLQNHQLKPLLGPEFEIVQVLPPDHLILKHKNEQDAETENCLYTFGVRKPGPPLGVFCPENGVGFHFIDPQQVYWYTDTDLQMNQIHHSDLTVLRDQLVPFNSPFPAYHQYGFGKWFNFSSEGFVITHDQQAMLYDYQGQSYFATPITTAQTSPICCFEPLASAGDYLFRNMEDQIFLKSGQAPARLLLSNLSDPHLYPFPSRWAARHSLWPLQSTGFWISKMVYKTEPETFWLYRYVFKSERLVSYPISERPVKLELSPSGKWLGLLDKAGKLSLYESASGHKQQILLPSEPSEDWLGLQAGTGLGKSMTQLILPPADPPQVTEQQVKHWCEFAFRHPGSVGTTECDILLAGQALKQWQRNQARRLLTADLKPHPAPGFSELYADLRKALGFRPSWKQTLEFGYRWDEDSRQVELMRIAAASDKWLKAPGRFDLDAMGRIIAFYAPQFPPNSTRLYVSEPNQKVGHWQTLPRYEPVDLAAGESSCLLDVSWGDPDLPSYQNFWYKIYCYDAEHKRELQFDPPPNHNFAPDASLLAMGSPLNVLLSIGGQYYLKSLVSGSDLPWEEIHLPSAYIDSGFKPLRLDDGQWLLPTAKGLSLGSPDLRHWQPTRLKTPLQEIGQIDSAHWWGRNENQLYLFGPVWKQETEISLPITLPFEGTFVASTSPSPIWIHTDDESFSWSSDLKHWRQHARRSRDQQERNQIFFYHGRFWDLNAQQLYALDPEELKPEWQLVRAPERVQDLIAARDIFLIATSTGVYRYRGGAQPWQRENRGLPNNATFFSAPVMNKAQTPERPVGLGSFAFIWTGKDWREATPEAPPSSPGQSRPDLQKKVDCQGHSVTHYVKQGEHQAAICDDQLWVQAGPAQNWQAVPHAPVTLAFDLIGTSNAWVYVHSGGLIRYELQSGSWQAIDLPLKQWTYNHRGDWALLGEKTLWYSSDQAQSWREIAYRQLCADCQGTVYQAVLREDRLSFLFGEYWMGFPLPLQAPGTSAQN